MVDSQTLKASGAATKIIKQLDEFDHGTKLAILGFVHSLLAHSAGAQFSTNDPGDEAFEADLRHL